MLDDKPNRNTTDQIWESHLRTTFENTTISDSATLMRFGSVIVLTVTIRFPALVALVPNLLARGLDERWHVAHLVFLPTFYLYKVKIKAQKKKEKKKSNNKSSAFGFNF
uniref:Uncharacterized protein n=1 Tax=Strigamia maritima TaxID=126957 RepID=T1IWT5_STRMM